LGRAVQGRLALDRPVGFATFAVSTLARFNVGRRMLFPAAHPKYPPHTSLNPCFPPDIAHRLADWFEAALDVFRTGFDVGRVVFATGVDGSGAFDRGRQKWMRRCD
jgi:hypothetical protein